MVKFCAVLMLALVLCSCATPPQAENASDTAIPSAHADLLAHEYNAMAMLAQINGAYKMASFFNTRGSAAGRGQWVIPETATDPVLLAAHQTLMQGLTDAMIPENALWLARAQVNYECWLKQADGACRQRFEKAMQSVTY